MTRLFLASIVLVGCAPQHVDTWAVLLDLDGVDVHDPHAQDLAAEAWCQHGAELASLVGPEVLDAMPAGDLPACAPAGWVDLGHGVYCPTCPVSPCPLGLPQPGEGS